MLVPAKVAVVLPRGSRGCEVVVESAGEELRLSLVVLHPSDLRQGRRAVAGDDVRVLWPAGDEWRR